MEEDFNQYNEDEDYAASLDRFEQMLKKNEHYFFDVEEFEILIDHYLEKTDTKKAKKVIDISLKQHPTSSTLKLKKAQFLTAIHKPNKALEILNSLEVLEPFNSEIFWTALTFIKTPPARAISRIPVFLIAFFIHSRLISSISFCMAPAKLSNLSYNILFL